MKIKRINLNNFRNYENLELSVDGSRNIFVGENAQGKTNILEAIYMCAFSRSFRTQRAQDMVRFENDSAKIMIEMEREEIDKKIEIEIIKNGKKMISIDGKNIRRTAELLNNLVVVIFSPEDLRIIKDSPDKRRNFIDREISQIKPAYHESLRNYNEVLRQKNFLLKGKEDIDVDLLDTYDDQLAIYGKELIGYREEFIKNLSETAGKIQEKISGEKEKLEVIYDHSVEKENIKDKIKESRERDMEAGYSLVGPHRDDILFYINEREAKKYGSQGQHRTIALSLKLAEIKIAEKTIGESPILLLDDVMSELDAGRQNFLINEIHGSQIFITTTEISDNIYKNMSNISIINVKKGKAEKERSKFDE